MTKTNCSLKSLKPINFVIALIVLFLLIGISGCTNKKSEIKNDSNISIAAFNIQVFGKGKAANPIAMEIIAKTIRRFDIVAIQEIRDADGKAIIELLDLVNKNGSYKITVGPRLGRTSSKEQYAYFYNKKVELVKNYTYNDSLDYFHREPYFAKFISGNLTIELAVLHTDPDEAKIEIEKIQEVVNPGTIIVGDLNADCKYFNELNSSNKKFRWIIGNEMDTTVKNTNCTYDRIIITGNETISNYGVFRFDNEFGLNQSIAEKISDHYPVYAIIINRAE